MKLVVINYGSGNLRSVAKAFERASLDSGWDGRIAVSDESAEVRSADYVVLPGVGAFGDCARGLRAVAGMYDALSYCAREKQRPFLGICVGMQLMADRGLEHGVHQGLGWIGGEVRAMAPGRPDLKIPHMGWNTLTRRPGAAHPVLAGMDAGADCYFLHSYQFIAGNPEDVLATTDYGGSVNAAVGRDNMLGVQFHPEKSQAQGLRLLANFLAWKP
ncbi:MAG: imidazole glycerol phosphate synthase subunit HisH [Alphaproteobacteria bacterium]